MTAMDPTSIETRLRLGEDSRTEFKSVAANNFDVIDYGYFRIVLRMR